MSFLAFPVGHFTQSFSRGSALRFDGVEERLRRTPAGNSTSRLKLSVSFWFRVPTLGQFNPIFSVDNGTGGSHISISSGNKLQWVEADGVGAVYRNVVGATSIVADRWYHGFVVYDSTLAEADRGQIWLDGVRDSGGTTTTIGTSFGLGTLEHAIGWHSNTNTFFEGDLAIFHWVDGAAMAVTDFAQTIDGVLQAVLPVPTYQQNGCFLPFADPDDIAADFDNGTTWTVSNMDGSNLVGDGPYVSY